MISDEAEYPELHRTIKLVPRDPKMALDPRVCEYLDEVVRQIQPLVDKAMANATYDLITYGRPTLTVKGYVLEAMGCR